MDTAGRPLARHRRCRADAHCGAHDQAVHPSPVRALGGSHLHTGAIVAGRHRKPTHTGRSLAAVGAAVSVSASGGFASVGTAEARVPDPQPAESTGVLDAIADCESSGNPRASNGTHFGLFQFSPATWRSVGGTGDPRNASVAEQYRRAAALLAKRGTQPWNASKSCWSRKVGAVSSGRSSGGGTVPSVAPKQRQSTAPRNTAGVTGKRAADGTGSYVCTTALLSFDACDEATLGTVQQYPPYGGKHRSPAPANAASASSTTRPVAASSGPSASRVASLLVTGARGYIGTPYRYGGTTRAGLDCSGLIWTVLRDFGLNPPRTSAAQYAWTRRISAAEAKPGDLVFFYSPVSHVGIYIGDGKMIDASRPGTTVSVHSVYRNANAQYGRIPA